MYREKALILLEKLNSFNYNQKPQYLMDLESQQIIKSVINECKSTILIQNENDVKAKRYESSITIESVSDIVNELLANSTKISRQTMNKIIYENGAFAGLDTDVRIYKGINPETSRFEAYASEIYVDERDFLSTNIREEIEQILKGYARELILRDSKSEDKKLPKINKFRLFIERSFHKPFSVQRFEKEYIEMLKKHSGIKNEEALTHSARYKVRQITSPKFTKKILESIKNGTAIMPLDLKFDKFANLQNQISAEIFEQMERIPKL